MTRALVALVLLLAGCSSDEPATRDFPDEGTRAVFLEVAGGSMPSWSQEQLLEEAAGVCARLGDEPSQEGWLLEVKRYTDAGEDAQAVGGFIAVSVATLCPELSSVLPSM